jgi:peroxiredoxin
LPLVLLNVVLLFNIHVMNKRYKTLKGQVPISLDYAPNFILDDMEGKTYELDKLANNSSFILLVFFSPMDCGPCLEEKFLWQEISNEGRIKVVGVGRHVDARELRDWINNSGLSFPVLYDIESRVTRSFGIRRTPLKILLDSKRKILLADTARISSFEQEEFISELKRAVGD